MDTCSLGHILVHHLSICLSLPIQVIPLNQHLEDTHPVGNKHLSHQTSKLHQGAVMITTANNPSSSNLLLGYLLPQLILITLLKGRMVSLITRSQLLDNNKDIVKIFMVQVIIHRPPI